jgi:transcriptional regulator with XRE-family HTH domain
MAATWIKDRRKHLRLSQEDVAAQLQLNGFSFTSGAVSHWENGRHAPPLENPDFRQALANVLRLDVRGMLTLAGYELTSQEHTEAGERAAYIVDRLPPDKQELAIGILEQLLERV